eukprot:8483524-Pyramimonas_sp.AAC.1
MTLAEKHGCDMASTVSVKPNEDTDPRFDHWITGLISLSTIGFNHTWEAIGTPTRGRRIRCPISPTGSIPKVTQTRGVPQPALHLVFHPAGGAPKSSPVGEIGHLRLPLVGVPIASRVLPFLLRMVCGCVSECCQRCQRRRVSRLSTAIMCWHLRERASRDSQQ